MIHYSPSGSQARMLVSPPPRRPSVHRFGPPMGIFFPSDRDFDPATSSATSLIPPRHMGLTVCSQSPQNLGSSVRESSASFGASQRTASAASSKPPSAPYISTSDPAAGAMVGSGGKKTTRDSKRKATHSQIERRRREKIVSKLSSEQRLPHSPNDPAHFARDVPTPANRTLVRHCLISTERPSDHSTQHGARLCSRSRVQAKGSNCRRGGGTENRSWSSDCDRTNGKEKAQQEEGQ